MPPTGSQPVRAARNTRTSDVRSGGIDSSSTDAVRTRLGQQPAAAAAGDDAEREADERGERERAEREDGAVGGALRDELLHRPVVEQRAAEVEADRAGTASRAYWSPIDRFRP